MLTKSGLVRWFAITQSLNSLNFAATSTVNDSGNPPESCSPIAITMTTATAQIAGSSEWAGQPASCRRNDHGPFGRSELFEIAGRRRANRHQPALSIIAVEDGGAVQDAHLRRRPPPRGRDGRSSP